VDSHFEHQNAESGLVSETADDPAAFFIVQTDEEKTYLYGSGNLPGYQLDNG